MGIMSLTWKSLSVVRLVLRIIRPPFILLLVVHRTKFCVLNGYNQIKADRILREIDFSDVQVFRFPLKIDYLLLM